MKKVKLTDSFAKELVENNFISEEEYEICKYGMENLLISCIEILSVLPISIFFDTVSDTIFFLATLVLLRRYTGGFHARTPKGCYAFFVAVYFSFTAIVKYMPIKYSSAFEILSIVITNLVVLKYAPIVNGNKNINQLERKMFRRFGIIITQILSVIVCIGVVWLGFKKYILSISIGLLFVSITMLIAVIFERRW